MQVIDPANIVRPASKYAQGVLHGAVAKRLVVSGQVGANPDGSIEQGLEALPQPGVDRHPPQPPALNPEKTKR